MQAESVGRSFTTRSTLTRWVTSLDLRHPIILPNSRCHPQDKADDVKIGVRSTALLFGIHTRAVLSVFSASSVSLFALAGYVNAQGLPYFAGVGLAGWYLARVLWRTDFDDRKSCWDGFKACGLAGAALWVGATVDYGMMLAGCETPLSALW